MNRWLLPIIALCPAWLAAHTVNSDGIPLDQEALRRHILDEFMASRATTAPKPAVAKTQVAASSGFSLAPLLQLNALTASAPAGNGALMAASFAPFKPKVRFYWDASTFYEESDNMPDNMPNRMVGITSWQQQIPLPVAYFANTTNPENTATSLGYGQPNYWRLPLVPTVAASPTLIFTPGSSSNNFQRGAIAIAANGIAIFNPANNTGRVSYEIGELDYYGGHCGLADDYHYHIIPMHLSSRFGGQLSDDKPVAWALDGYPIYGYVEPDGTARQALDSNGGHDIGNGWGYHYHAVGTTTVDASHPFGTPQSPYTMTSFRGTVVNFGGQVDGQPEVGSIRASGTGGYTAQPVSGASIIAYKNPVALTTDGSGNLVENIGGTPSADSFLMRVSIAGTSYDECWKINRSVVPRTMTVTWRLAGATTTTTYTPTAGTAAGNRLTAYTMAASSQTKLPDTSQTLDTTATFGEDADYTINAQSFTDNANGTVTDNVTGLMWQKTDNGESTWETAVANASSITTGGYTDWRLPTPGELFALLNHNNGNPAAIDTTYFPSNPAGAAEYWWSSDTYGTSTSNVWCANAGGGLGGKPKTETISAGGTFRYHARYVRGTKPTNGHNYVNNNDGTITDTDTGLMWTQVPAAATGWDSALSYAENLSLGGYSDWRLPNIKELQTLTDYTLTTATSTTGIKPSINRTMFAKTLTGCITTANGTTITCNDTTGLLPGMPLVDTTDAAGAYLPSATPPVVATVLSLTSFTVTSGTGIIAGSNLTFKALAVPTAYWSSTSLKGDSTKAWLLETGINNSVLAANGPTRNSQGIISYEAKTSAYPVFAVRTTSVTTQIAVTQNGTSLTDGVSTVSYGNVNVGSNLTKTFIINNTGATSLTITGVTLDNASSFAITASPSSTVAAGGSTSLDVRFTPGSAGTKVTALHIASSDTAVGAAFDITLSGTGYVPPPAIASVSTSPAVPSNTDTPYITASITPSGGATITSAQLTYSTGAVTTTTVFNETMAATATGGTGGWDGTGAVYAWTPVTKAGAGNIKQTTAANHTTAGAGNPCGLELSKGSATASDTMVTTTNAIAAAGTSGYVEFWAATTNVTSGLGWQLQLAGDGTTFTTRLSDLGGTAHSFQKYHYDLAASELTSTLKMQFQFIGNGVGGPTAPKVQIDDIIVVVTAGVPPVTVTMYDDGLHGDGAAGDGVYGVQLPAQASGTGVSYSITATDSNGSATTLASAGAYTTGPAPSITTATLPAGSTLSAYPSTTLAATGGTPGYTWSLSSGSLPSGLTLSPAGAISGTATAAGSFNFTVKVTDAAGRIATKALSISITATTPPNIVIILTDDQGWGDVGYHTYPGRIHIDTPNMDSFATSGIRIERFYPTAVCSVTRACLQTGRNTIRTGVNNTRGLDLSEHILPQTFSAAGYQTFITGKWHCGGPENNICFTMVNGQSTRIIQEGDQYRPFNRGWMLHYGEYGVIDAFTHYDNGLLNPVSQPTWLRPDWWLNGTQYADSDPTQHTDSQGHGGYATDLLADKAVSIITNAGGERDTTKPMLLYLAFSQIHGPVAAPPEYLAKYGTPSDPTHYIADVPARTIAASVDCMDVAMGRVLNALNTAGMTNNTIVLFMSDNGGENATGGSDLPLRGAKTEPYDGGIRTPCGIRYPGQLAGGLQVTHCVTTSASTTVTCDSTSGLYAGMALAGTGLAYGSTVASVTDGTHFVLSTAPTTGSSPSSFTVTAGVISNLFFWVGDVFPTLCAATGVTPLNTKPFDGLNMWPALKSVSGANPDGTQTRFQTNPDGSKNTSTPNISPLITLASPNVAFNVYTDPVSGQPKVFKDIYSQSSSAVILTHCATVANSTTVTCDSTTDLTTGGSIYGSGIKGGATVASITDSTHFVMSDPPNVAYASITLNVGFPANQLFNIQDDPYETTDCLLAVNQAALGLTQAQIKQFTTISSTMQALITGISPNVYPPYVGPAQITSTVAQGGTIQLYVPFTSYAKNAPTINWRKNGANLIDGTTASGSTITGSTTFTVNTTSPDSGYGSPSVPTNGACTTILTISNASYADAGSYDLVISNVDTFQAPNVTNTVYAPAGVLTVTVGAPSLTALPAFTRGTSQTVSWSAVTSATSYTVQAATDINFTNVVSTKTGSATSATFTGLSDAVQYWFRATATDGITTSVFSSPVTSTQDATSPAVAITSPANGSVASQPTITVTGTASDLGSGIASVTVNGIAATTSDGFAHWSASVVLGVGGNTITAVALDNAQSGGNSGTASANVTLSPTAPVISSVSIAPTAPAYLDPVTVLASVQPGTGAALTQVQLTYTTGTPVTSTVFRELFSNTGTNNWDGSVTLGALNPWTKTAVRSASDVRQVVGSANNNTAPVALTSCATTNGSTVVTCASTANLWPGMLITGSNIASGTKVASIANSTTFALSASATGSGAGLTLTAAGVTLANSATNAGSTTVTCDSTAGLLAGMGLSGAGLANNATVTSITDGTTFVMSAPPVTPGSALTFTASGAGAELINGTANPSDTMIATTNGINLTGGSAGYVEFYLATSSLAATNNCQWAFQVSPDGGATWSTRLSENWNAQTVNLSNCVLNTTGNAGGSTIVTCASTTGLAAGQAISGTSIYVTGTLSNSSPVVTNTNTSALAVGMFVAGSGGSGIPNNARILSIDSATQFTMSVNATATGAGVNMAATYFASNATVSSVTNSTTFVLNTAAFANTTASPVPASATTANHAFAKYHYDLAPDELGPSVKLRFQYAGYVPQSPTKAPNMTVDDIIVVKSTPAPPTLVTMYDDGLHGDGAAGDGLYAAQIPAQPGGTAVNYTITASDTHSTSTTYPGSGSLGYVVSSSLTNATIVNAEHLSMPSDQGITINAVAASAQEAFVEYGTSPGAYTNTTPVTAFTTSGVNNVYPVAITLSGLQQNTRYYYRLRHRNVGGTLFNARGERSFHTARPRGSPFVFTLFADPHLDVNTYSDPSDATHVPQLLNRALDNVSADQPDFHMDLGDILMTDKLTLTDGTGIPDYWGGSLGLLRLNLSNLCSRAAIFRTCYERVSHSVPFLGTLGNHEAEYGYLFAGASDPQNNIPAWDLFARNTYFPAPAPSLFYGGNTHPVNYTGGSLGLPRNYYAWEWGNALFIVLDPYWNTVSNPNQTNNAWNWSLGKTQYDWLKATLQNSSASYKFVFLHHLVGGTWTLADGVTANCAGRGGVEVAPYFEWGGRNTDGSDGFAANRPGWDMPVHSLLVQNKVNIVFHGHDHLYGYQTLDGMVYLECPQPGTRNYTQLGSAADGKYAAGTLLPNSGHIRVTVGPNQSLAEYVRAYLPADENATTHNRDVAHSFTVASSNAALANLVPSGGSLSPAFAAGATSFTVTVPNSTSSLSLTPTTSESGEVVKVNNVVVASGSQSAAITLSVGSNAIAVFVTAPDGITTSTYSVTVIRQSALESWRNTWFGSADNSGIGSDTSDPFHTGIPNLAAYALFGPAQNPATVQQRQLPQPVLSGGSFTTSFTEPFGVSGVAYSAEWSSDLRTWTSVPDTGAGTQHVFSVPATTKPRVFMRIRITRS